MLHREGEYKVRTVQRNPEEDANRKKSVNALRLIIAEWMHRLVEFFVRPDNRKVVSISLSMLDRYCDASLGTCDIPFSVESYRLVAVTCLFVANKVHGDMPLKIEPLCKCTGLNGELIRRTEEQLLNTLEWKINPVMPADFVPHLGRCLCFPRAIGGGDSVTSRLLFFSSVLRNTLEICDVASLQYSSVDYLPSDVAVSAILLGSYRALLGKGAGITVAGKCTVLFLRSMRSRFGLSVNEGVVSMCSLLNGIDPGDGAMEFEVLISSATTGNGLGEYSCISSLGTADDENSIFNCISSSETNLSKPLLHGKDELATTKRHSPSDHNLPEKFKRKKKKITE